MAYMKVSRENSGGKIKAQSVKAVLVGYFSRGDYKLLKRETGQIFRSHNVIFEEGAPHRTLPDACIGDTSNIYEIFEIETTADKSNNAGSDVQAPAIKPNILSPP